MLIRPLNLDFPDIKAVFTTRVLTDVRKCHISDALAVELGAPEAGIYLPVQRHTGTVHVLGPDQAPVVADAVVTSRRNVLIGVLVADCVPILLCDSVSGVIGAVHAGWKGTAQAILKNTIMTMVEVFGCRPSGISVAIGPSIRQGSYQVGEEVIDGVRGATGAGDYYCQRDGRYYIDLSDANRLQALSLGVRPEDIWQSAECTFRNPQRFYSYRYSKAEGRQGGFIGMW